MTQATNPSETLAQWWNTIQFEGKNLCKFDPETGEISLLKGDNKPLSVLNTVTGETVILHLVEKYQQISKQMEELEHEWEQAEDKLRLMSKVERISEHLERAKYIGEAEKITDKLSHMNTDIQAMIEKNHQAKEAIIKEASSLTIENNNWKDVSNRLKELQEEWKTIGFIDKKRNDELWAQLENIKSRFFEEKRHHQEDIEKEMLQNLDLKMELVEKAKALADSDDWKETSEAYKQLLADWKQIGRTMSEKNEQLWQEFISAKNNFFDRKKQHTEGIRVEQEQNLQLKIALVEKAEMLQNSTDWNITANAFNELMNEWKKIGPVPSEQSDIIWKRFSQAKETFYTAKRQEAETYKTRLQENYAKKMSLIERAEAIKNSTLWRETTEEMNSLLEEWKTVGHAGKEHSETLWEQFISARKHFYNRKDQDRERRKVQHRKNKELQLIQAQNFLQTLIKESEDEQAQIQEFKETLGESIEGPKSEEIKAHLSGLILELEQKGKARASKIEDMKNQVETLERESQAEENKSNEQKAPHKGNTQET